MKFLKWAGVLSAVSALSLAFPPQLHAAEAQAEQAVPQVKLWRLACGEMPGIRLNMFSDTLAYGDKVRDLTVSCYLIKHGDQYMIWDTGFGTEFIGKEPEGYFNVTVDRSLVDQLGDLGLAADDIAIVGVSHLHGDHIGQANSFPKAKLLMGVEDLNALRADVPGPQVDPARIAPWLAADSNAEGVVGDVDIFADGSVKMLAMPGHTHGHHVLLVQLARTGPVLLSGDQFHFTEQLWTGGVPPFNVNRADTLASHDRFQTLANNIGATVIIQHEVDDVGKLPAFPEAAE